LPQPNRPQVPGIDIRNSSGEIHNFLFAELAPERLNCSVMAAMLARNFRQRFSPGQSAAFTLAIRPNFTLG
jgi:hypothetical protein